MRKDRGRQRDTAVAMVAGAGLIVAVGAALTLVPWSRVGRAAGQMPPSGWAITVGLMVAATAGSMALASRTRAARSAGRQPIRVLSLWLLAVYGALVVAVTAGSVVWLLAEANRASTNDRVQARLDAIRTGLGAGAGVGAALALLLAARRQRLGERTQQHTEEVAADTRYDATERRITELYTRAVEQLGHGQPAVRLGGLYALERLAQSNWEHRQTIVNVLCSYLRMPPSQLGQPTPNWEEVRSEEQVRKAAVRILAIHLRPGQDAEPADTFWPNIDLDLTDVRIVPDIDLTSCRVRNVIFDNASFTGTARFDDTQFTGDAEFNRTLFNDAYFNGAQFDGSALFSGARFNRNTSFDGTRFAQPPQFNGALSRVTPPEDTVRAWPGWIIGPEETGEPHDAGGPWAYLVEAQAKPPECQPAANVDHMRQD